MKIHSLGRIMGKCAALLVPVMWTVLISQTSLHFTVFATTTGSRTTQTPNLTTVAPSIKETASRTTQASDLITVAPSTVEPATPVQPPVNLTVTTVANDTLNVTWYGSCNHGYRMQWYVDGALNGMRSVVVVNDTGDYWEELTDLGAGQLYNVTVQANTSTAFPEVYSRYGITWPNLPGGVKVVSITTGTISLQWNEPRGRVDGYIVTYCNDTCFSVSTNLTSVTLDKLHDGCLYNISLRSQSHNVSSYEAWTTTQPTQPLPPSNITISGKPEETFVTIIISPPVNTEFDGFNITWTNMDNNKTKSLVLNTSQQMEIVSNVTGLEAGHLYKLGVRTLSKNISSDQAWLCPSGQFLAKPSLPVTISVTVVNETALLVKWSQVHGQCTNIKIAYTADRDSARPDVMKQCNGSMAVLAELKSNLQYNIIFTTQRSKNNITSVSDVYARSIWTWSAEVTDLKHQPESPTSLQLSWMFPVLNAKEHLRHYVVEVLDPLTSECLYGVLLSNTQLSPVRNTTGCERGWKSGHFTGFDDVTYSLDSLDACANYSVKVFAVNMPGDAGVSNEITVTMPVGEPTSSVVINSTSSAVNSVYIEWLELKLEHSKCTVVTYEINYTYKNCSTDQPEEVIFNSTSMTSENITHLQPYWNYTFTVSAYTDAGKGGSVSEYVNVTTQEAVPGPPRLPNVISRSHDTINIAWQPPTRCEMNGILTQYNVYYSFTDPLHHTLITRNVSVPSGQTRAMLTEAIHPFTIYSLTIHGMTIGQGEPSTTTPTRTAEWYPGVINSSSLTFETSPSSVVVSWDEPLSPNGVIINYIVCFKCHHVRIDMSCDHPNEQLTTNDSRTMMQVDGLRPYKRFEFRVKASTGVGAGNYSQPRYVMTDIGVPLQPEGVVVQSNEPDTVYVEWKLPRYCAGPTNYTVFVVDVHDPTNTFTSHKKGCHNHLLTVKGLDAYWTYKVTVVAETIKGNSSSHTLDVTTMQADPRAVGGLQARAQGRKCNEPTLKIEWNTLTGRDKRGVIQNYTLHFSTTLGENFTRSFKEGTNRSQLEYVPVSPERQYMIQIWAYSEQKKGEVAPALHVNSGACPPKLPETEAEGFTGPTSLIYFPDVNSEKTQYTLMVNQSFFNDASNGALQERGAIVMDADEGGSYAERFDNHSHFHSEYNRRWTDVKDASTVKSYRVILDHNVRSRRATVVPSGGHKIVLGQDGNCDNDPSANCNGYLRANSKYKVRVYTCTVSGCSVTAPSKSFQTAAYSKAGAIVAATLVPIIIVVLIVIVLVFIMRKQQLGPFRKKKTRPEGAGNGGKLNEAFVELEEVDPKQPGTISQKGFVEHVKMMHMDSDLHFSEEYGLLKMLSPRNPTTAADLPPNRPKNRYTNILPFDLSRVKLLPIEDDESSDYINANYVPGYNSRREFIAAQGPLPSTKDDFWRMIWEQNVPIIVMLTRLVEKGREKCSQYWPQDNEAVYYGDLQVSMRSESVLDSYTIRIFDIQLGQMKRMIKQFHFTMWNDFVVPETTEVMLNFVHVVRSHVRPNFKGPIVVHCSAGVGRSGTYICVDHLLQHIRDYDGINIFGMVLEMRQYRCSMVQTEYQYIYIHDCLRDALEKQQQEEDEEADEADGPIYANVDEALR